MEEARAAAERLEEERKAAELRVEQERLLERERVHAERLRKWEELNRTYPIPEFLRPYVTGVREDTNEDLDQDRFINVGVLGDSGVGKSSLIKAILEHFKASLDGHGPVSCYEGDGTVVPHPYKVDSFGDKVRIWDIPGQGTSTFPAKTYLRDMGLKYFDDVLVVTDGRLTENDVHLIHAIKFAEIWSCVVRTKVDQAVADGKEDHGDSQETVLEKVHTKLMEQLAESDPAKVHLVTVRKQYWAGMHGGHKFGTIDALCEQVAERVGSEQTWLLVDGDGPATKRPRAEK